MAGLGSGLTEALVVNPFEVVKVSLQANRDSFKVVRDYGCIIVILILKSRLCRCDVKSSFLA